MDALFASDSMEALTAAPESLQAALNAGGVLWVNGQTPSQAIASAKQTGVPVILHVTPDPSAAGYSFTSAARVMWREDAQGFFPGGVLTLADLGSDVSWELPRPDSSNEAIAWAEQQGRHGLLFWRRKGSATPLFTFVMPSLWSSRFHPGADERILHLQERWVQGAAEWARVAGARLRAPVSQNPATMRSALDVEMSRLGVDEEALYSLGISTRGNALHDTGGDALFLKALPDLPRGQMEETHSKSHLFFPAGVTTLAIIALLCAAWAARKKLHLD